MNTFQVLVVRRGYPPYEKKLFFAFLHELEHVKKGLEIEKNLS